MNALLAGLKKRHISLGDRPILIHTAGTGMLFEPRLHTLQHRSHHSLGLVCQLSRRRLAVRTRYVATTTLMPLRRFSLLPHHNVMLILPLSRLTKRVRHNDIRRSLKVYTNTLNLQDMREHILSSRARFGVLLKILSWTLAS
jgi:hypothetical protein